MMTLLFYLLKVVICSGILSLYYQLALKNKLFHQWNRFYLLISVVLSLLLPLVQIKFFAPSQHNNKAIQLIQVVQSADDYLEEVTVSTSAWSSPEQWMLLFYWLISAFIFLSLLLSISKIVMLLRSHKVQILHAVKFVVTKAQGTPFSFLDYIFWNENLSLQSEAGQQIFRHELVHVREKHTMDKLFMQTVLVLFWCNPFFWLMRKELRFIHEFIADKKAIGTGDTAAFAAMILQTAYPQHYNSIINPFFQTSIKRRFLMLTKIQRPGRAYLSRLVALPLLAFVALLFSFRTKNNAVITPLDQDFVVVIDAGHGMKDGRYTGANAADVYEDELTLQLAQEIKALNQNEHLKIILSRNSNALVDLKERVALAQREKADLFLSLHMSATVPAAKEVPEGLQIYVAPPPSANSILFGSAITNELGSFFKSSIVKQSGSIFVLKQLTCPALLVECGNISLDRERLLVEKASTRKILAQHFLDAIQRYAAQSKANELIPPAIDTPPAKKEIKSIDVTKANRQIIVTYADGSIERLTEQEAMKKGLVHNGGYGNFKNQGGQKFDSLEVYYKRDKETKIKITGPASVDQKERPLVVIDGKEIPDADISKIDPNKIESVNILKDKPATDKYGEKGKKGVIEITTKGISSTELMKIQQNGRDVIQGRISKLEVDRKNEVRFEADFIEVKDNKDKDVIVDNSAGRESSSNLVFVKSEREPSIDALVWRKFLEQNVLHVAEKAAAKGAKGQFSVVMQFVVNEDGSLTDIKPTKNDAYGMGESLSEVLKNSPKWTPAEQNGKPVASYFTKPVTIVIQEQ